MLTIKNVSAIVDTQQVLSDINIEIKEGEIHAIMGPKLSGKSTIAHLIQGNPYITQTSGSIVYKNKNISKLGSHKRSRLGIFTSFQYPPEIEGKTRKDSFEYKLIMTPSDIAKKTQRISKSITESLA